MIMKAPSISSLSSLHNQGTVDATDGEHPPRLGQAKEPKKKNSKSRGHTKEGVDSKKMAPS